MSCAEVLLFPVFFLTVIVLVLTYVLFRAFPENK